MAFNVNVTNSCKILALWSKQYDVTSTQADIVFQNIETGAQHSVVMNYTAGKGRINVPVDTLPTSNGVYSVCLSENSVQYICKPVLIKCDIDCCLTKLTNELIDCACDCPRCASSLAKAQKIYLLLQSAEAAVEIASNNPSTGYFQDILHKYKKAREICDNSCGCDC